MKTIRVKFVDFWPGFNEKDNDFYNIMEKHYNVEISDKPDYLIYSVFGKKHLNYNCIRIFYTGECVCPDFNLCDYAIGFENIRYDDRYIRVPLYMLFEYKNDYLLALEKHKLDESLIKNKNRFCNFIYSNRSAQKVREDFFKKLSEYKRVDSGGRFLNNIDGPIEDKKDKKKTCKIVS